MLSINACHDVFTYARRFLQQNALTSLASSPPLPTLVTLDVSNNPLETLEGLKQYPELRTLRATHTMLSNLDALADLQGCPHLESLDLSSSKLHASELLAYLAVATPQLRCLYLQGSPLASDLAHYRKRCIAALPRLQYLDDRPVSAKDRRCAEAWDRGGPEAEARERQLCLEEARAQLQGHASAFLRRGEGATLLGKDEEEEGAKSKAEPANSTLEVDADGEARGEAAAEHGGSWSASDEAPWPAKDASRVLPTTSTEIGEDEEAGSCSVGAPLSRADPSCCREPAEENVLRPRRPC